MAVFAAHDDLYDLMPDCFLGMAAEDGYRAEKRESNEHGYALEVWLVFSNGGEVHYVKRVWQHLSTREDVAATGEQARVWTVWQAIARYLNAGGKMPILEESVLNVSRDGDFPEWIWPQGYCLIDTVQVVARPQHIIANLQTMEAVVWTEDEAIEFTTLPALAEQDTDEPAIAPQCLDATWTSSSDQFASDLQAEAAD